MIIVNTYAIVSFILHFVGTSIARPLSFPKPTRGTVPIVGFVIFFVKINKNVPTVLC